MCSPSWNKKRPEGEGYSLFHVFQSFLVVFRIFEENLFILYSLNFDENLWTGLFCFCDSNDVWIILFRVVMRKLCPLEWRQLYCRWNPRACVFNACGNVASCWFVLVFLEYLYHIYGFLKNNQTFSLDFMDVWRCRIAIRLDILFLRSFRNRREWNFCLRCLESIDDGVGFHNLMAHFIWKVCEKNMDSNGKL